MLVVLFPINKSYALAEVTVEPTEKPDPTLDACSDDPCGEMGTCILDDHLGYRCACKLGFSGPTCEQGNECMSQSEHWSKIKIFV